MARQRAYLLITLFAVLLVLLPFLFWYFTWFGRKLTDAEIGEYLADSSKPRHAQHALVQLGERMARGDKKAAQWYPEVVRLAASPGLKYARLRRGSWGRTTVTLRSTKRC